MLKFSNVDTDKRSALTAMILVGPDYCMEKCPLIMQEDIEYIEKLIDIEIESSKRNEVVNLLTDIINT